MSKRRLAVLLISVLVSGLVIAGCSPTTEGELREGSRAPDFQLTELGGEAVSLSDMRGMTVLLNFWATWCPPCRAEMPYIQQIYEEGASRGLMVLAVNLGESPAEVKEFMESNNLSFPVLLDINKEVGRSYGIQAIPTTFIIDQSGIIRVIEVGAFTSEDEIERVLGKVIS